MSMCVARPENASLQPPPSVFPTPCASGRSVQQGNAVRVTLSWPHAARTAHAARIALPRQVWIRLRCPKLRREISDFDGHWKFSSPPTRRCETPCGEEYCCLGRRAKKATLSLEGVPNARLATLTSPLLISVCFWQWMRVCCHGHAWRKRRCHPRRRPRRPRPCRCLHRLPSANTLTTALLPPRSPPVIISDAQCGRVYASIDSCAERAASSNCFCYQIGLKKARSRLKLSSGAPPHTPGSV